MNPVSVYRGIRNLLVNEKSTCLDRCHPSDCRFDNAFVECCVGVEREVEGEENESGEEDEEGEG